MQLGATRPRRLWPDTAPRRTGLGPATMPGTLPRDTLCVANVAGVIMDGASGVTRCPHCGAIQGGSSAALDALYQEVSRLGRLAQEAGDREADLRREVRLLRETVARLRAGITT